MDKTKVCFYGEEQKTLLRLIAGNLPVRPKDSHKGTFGRLLVAAGSKGMAGAAYLCGLAAFRCGTGMVRFYTPECNRVILQMLLPEAMVCTEEEDLKDALDWADCIAVGPGMGTGMWAGRTLDRILSVPKPTVIDADALNLIGTGGWQDRLTDKMVITPHPGEFERLGGKTPAEFSERFPAVLVHKGYPAKVYRGGSLIFENPCGSSALAKAGSGDVLCGVTAAMLAQGCEPKAAAVTAVCLHALAGELAGISCSEYGTLARDVANLLPCVLKEAIK